MNKFFAHVVWPVLFGVLFVGFISLVSILKGMCADRNYGNVDK